jgi:hypothetical protein
MVFGIGTAEIEVVVEGRSARRKTHIPEIEM